MFSHVHVGQSSRASTQYFAHDETVSSILIMQVIKNIYDAIRYPLASVDEALLLCSMRTKGAVCQKASA